jgi:hypothetical protein
MSILLLTSCQNKPKPKGVYASASEMYSYLKLGKFRLDSTLIIQNESFIPEFSEFKTTDFIQEIYFLDDNTVLLFSNDTLFGKELWFVDDSKTPAVLCIRGYSDPVGLIYRVTIYGKKLVLTRDVDEIVPMNDNKGYRIIKGKFTSR